MEGWFIWADTGGISVHHTGEDIVSGLALHMAARICGRGSLTLAVQETVR